MTNDADMELERDHALLSLAAKAAGLKAQYSDNYGDFSLGEPYSHGEIRWNPLTDDGDAFRLMTALRIRLIFPDFEACGDTVVARCNELDLVIEQPLTAYGYRRAVVEIASELGKKMAA